MNAVFNQVEFIHRLEDEGLAHGAADAIANGIETGRRDLATKADLATAIGQLVTKADLDLKISEALRKQTNQLGAMLVGGLAVVTVLLGLLISLK